MVKRIMVALMLGLGLALAGCGMTCTDGVCVRTQPAGGVEWPEPAPEGPRKKPGPIVQTDSKGKRIPGMTIPPGAPVNPKKKNRERRVEFHMKRTEQAGATVEIEWMINGSKRLPLPSVTTGGWRHVEWVKPGSTAHLWISRNPGNKTRINCWITVNGRVPSAADRPDGVPMFNAEGSSKSPFDCYVSAYIP